MRGKTERSLAVLACAVLLAGSAMTWSMAGRAQQQESGQIRGASPAKGTPQKGGSNQPTGGAAAGPGEGGQAVAADPQHGTQAAAGADAAHGGQAPRGGLVAYPDRPAAPPEVIARGKSVYSVNCAFCHGSDAGGGSIGPNLLRSEVVLQDKDGEMILPIVHGARISQGMPKIDIADNSVPDIAAWLHSLKTGGNMKSTEKINIVVGNAATGKQTFTTMCGSCHTPASMQGFADKFPDPRSMQQGWLLPGRGAMAGLGPSHDAPGSKVPAVTATVTPASGPAVTGKLGVLDDFYVEVTTDDGVLHRYTRANDVPKVAVHDPLEAHRALFRKYNDTEIHDITAYLVTLK